MRERRADDACADRCCAHARCWVEEAHVTELTALLREGPAGDQLRRLARADARLRPPRTAASGRPADPVRDRRRLALHPVGHQPARQPRGWRGQLAYIDAAHRVHARVEDRIRTGKDCGIGRFPSHDFAINTAWLAAALIAATLLAWLRLIALDGDLARAEPKTLRYRVLHAAARLVRGGRRRRLKIPAPGPGRTR